MPCLPHAGLAGRHAVSALQPRHQLPALLGFAVGKDPRRARERQKQIELARLRNEPHPIGRDPRLNAMPSPEEV